MNIMAIVVELLEEVVSNGGFYVLVSFHFVLFCFVSFCLVFGRVFVYKCQSSTFCQWFSFSNILFSLLKFSFESIDRQWATFSQLSLSFFFSRSIFLSSSLFISDTKRLWIKSNAKMIPNFFDKSKPFSHNCIWSQSQWIGLKSLKWY